MQRRYPLEPLINYLTVNFAHDEKDLFEVEETGEIRVSNNRAAELLGSTQKTITIYRRDGIPEDTADAMASRLGRHPREFWLDVYDAPIDLLLTVPSEARKLAKKLLARGESIEHLDSGLVGRRRAS